MKTKLNLIIVLLVHSAFAFGQDSPLPTPHQSLPPDSGGIVLVSIGGATFNGGRVDKKFVTDNPYLIPVMQYSNTEQKWKITGFTMTIYDLAGKSKSFVSANYKFTKAMLTEISNASPGSKISFRKIHALETKSMKDKDVPPLEFTIK